MSTNKWEANALYVENVYGTFVDWTERFYTCPFCDEPVYECDWNEEELGKYLCPICEDIDREEDCDYETGFDPYLGCFTDDC